LVIKIFFESLGFNIGIFLKSLIFKDLGHVNIHMVKSTQLKHLRIFFLKVWVILSMVMKYSYYEFQRPSRKE
jgi:hypothetical protein